MVAIEKAGLRDKINIMIGGGQMDDEVRKYVKADAYGHGFMDISRELELLGPTERRARLEQFLREEFIAVAGLTLILGALAIFFSTFATPVVYAKCDYGAPRTIAIYWQYDTMPVTQPDAWAVPPFEGRIVEKPPFKKVLVARGAYNSKGPELAYWNALGKQGRGAAAFKLTETVVSTGVYGPTRNPMALGFYLGLLGGVVMSGSAYMLLYTVLGAIPVHAFNLWFFEERELALRYGESYRRYLEATPFLIPRVRKPPSGQE